MSSSGRRCSTSPALSAASGGPAAIAPTTTQPPKMRQSHTGRPAHPAVSERRLPRRNTGGSYRRATRRLQPGGGDSGTDRLRERDKPRQRSDRHGQVGHQPVGAEPQKVDALQLALPQAGAKHERNGAGGIVQLRDAAPILEALGDYSQHPTDRLPSDVRVKGHRAVQDDIASKGGHERVGVVRLGGDAKWMAAGGAHEATSPTRDPWAGAERPSHWAHVVVPTRPPGEVLLAVRAACTFLGSPARRI